MSRRAEPVEEAFGWWGGREACWGASGYPGPPVEARSGQVRGLSEDSREQPHEAEEGPGGLSVAGLACLPNDPSGGDGGQIPS